MKYRMRTMAMQIYVNMNNCISIAQCDMRNPEKVQIVEIGEKDVKYVIKQLLKERKELRAILREEADEIEMEG